MNILITGANGLLGRGLVNLLSQNHNIYAIVRDKSAFIENININKNINVIQLDLYDLDTNMLPENIDAVYYLAQSKKFREFPDGAKDVFEINVNSPFKIVNWAAFNKVKMFFYTSSGGVYKNPTEPVREFFDINANEKNGFYLDSKLSTEILIKNYSKFFDCFAILRPFFIYGPGQDQSMLIPRLISKVINYKEIKLSGENGIFINPIYIDDAAEIVSKLLSLNGEYIFNIAGNEVVSLKELVSIIGEISGVKPIFKYKENNDFDLVADNNLMKDRLSIPKILLREGINKTYTSLKL